MKIRHGGKESRQFRQVVESGEPGRKPVAVCVHIHLKFGDFFCEHSYPAVKVPQVQKPQLAALQILLHDESVGHGVGYRRARRQHYALSAVLLLYHVDLVHHFPALFGAPGADAQD